MADNDLNEVIEEFVADATVITVPIDDTLSVSNAAADAKAVGDALAIKADKSELAAAITVNGQEADAQGVIIVTAEDTAMSGTNPTTVKAAIEAVDAKTAEDIPVSSAPGAQTIAQAITGGSSRTADQISMSATDPTSVKQAVDDLNGGLAELEGTVTAIGGRTAADIRYQSGNAETIKQHVDAIDQGLVKSVYGTGPDGNGDVSPASVPYADNLTSDQMEQLDGAFIQRTTGGDLDLDGRAAWILKLRGNMEHAGFTPESIVPYVAAVPRSAPPEISAVLDEETFEAYVQTAGTYTLEYTEIGWSASPALYGLTVSNELEGDTISIAWDGENEPVMTVTAPRTAPPEITVSVDRDAFVAAVSASTTLTFVYSIGWNNDPEDYGITVNNEPVPGDQFMIVYVKEIRGTITPADPASFVSTGWNLYDPTAGYAKVVKYSDSMGYRIGGDWTAVSFCETPDGATTALTPDADGIFMVPGDGYVLVTDGNASTTWITTVWSNWGPGHEIDFEAYSADVISLTTIMAGAFPYGLCAVGDVKDEIDFGAKTATRRIARMEYSEANKAAAQATGRAFVYDENWIYIVADTPTVSAITAEAEYSCHDHGLEYFTGTAAAVDTVMLYGQNLKDKLRRAVITYNMTVAQVKGMGS